MKRPLRVLIIEDYEDDAVLLLRRINQYGFTPHYRIISQAADLEKAFDQEEWDIVISDYMIPGFGGLEALEFIQARKPEIPLIMVSGKINEEVALGAIRVGAKDYIAKDDLGRLGFAIERELLELNVRKQTKEALQESEAFSFSLLNNAPNPILVINADNSIKYINPALEKLTGYSQEEILGRPFPPPWWPMDKVKEYNLQNISAEKCQALIEERLFKKKNGELFWVTWNLGQIKEQGEPKYYIANWVDITDKKKAEEQIKYQAILVDNVSDAIISTDLDHNILTWNRAAERIYGWKQEEVLGKKIVEVIPLVNRSVTFVESLDNRLNKSGYWEGETIHKRRDGCDLNISNSVSRVLDNNGKTVGYVAIFRDITKMKQAEKKVRKSELKYWTLVEKGNDGIIIVQDGILKFINSNLIDKTGYSQEEFLDKPFLDFVAQEYREQVSEKYKTRTSGETAEEEIEIEILGKDGKKIPMVIRAIAIDYEGKHADMAIMRDITERKLSEISLRKSEENFHRSQDGSPLGIRITDQNEKTQYANQAMLDLLGYSDKEQFNTIPIRERLTPESYDAYEKRKEKHRRGEPVPSKYEMKIIRQNGEIRDLEAFRKEVLWNGKQTFQVLYNDITERRQLEEERRRSEKLDSIGTLAAGIAHDFNNLLTGIIGNISLAKNYREAHGEIFEILEEAEKASIRARDLTQQLLTFSRGGEPVKKLFDISKLIRESASFAVRGSSVRAEFVLPDNLWRIEADEGQISQVIDNLVINAVQSMPQGGTINVSAGNQIIEESNSPNMAAGTYVHISIADQGIGIPKEHQSRIFEPYFTTKQKGSGLGLATSYSIIKKHQGYISYNSESGKGTTFHIYLPASSTRVLSGNEASLSTPITGTGTILVVDDEQMIRRLLNTVISRAGYKVEESVNGEEAVAKYLKAKEGGNPFSAAIMDLTMPGNMGGKDATRKILDIDPDAKVIVSSGYSNDPIMSNYREYGFSGVITKPYNVDQLKSEIVRVIQLPLNR